MTLGRTSLSARILTFLFCLMVLFTTPGCLDSSESIGNIPKLVIYHPEDETKVYITSQNGDTIYDSLNITMDNDTTSRTQAYSLEVRTPDSSFELLVTVILGDHVYRFHSHLTITEKTEDDESIWKLTLEDRLHHNKTTEEELPYKQLLESV